MRQAGRYLPEYKRTRERAGSFWKLCTTPELALEVTLQPIIRFDFNAAIIFSDILVVPYALGQKVWFEEGSGPRLELFKGLAALGHDPKDWLQRLDFVYQSLSLARNKLGEDKALIGFAGGVWTLVVYMLGGGSPVDGHSAKAVAKSDPLNFKALLDLIGDAVAMHLGAQLDAGADLVQLFDSHAGMLNEGEFADWVVTPTKRLIEKLRARHPQALIIGFPRGAKQFGYQRYADETGVDAVSLDTNVDLAWAVQTLGARVALQGNLDPKLLVAGGTALDQAVDNIIEYARGTPFIFNLGHGVLPETPIAHVERMVSRIRSAT